MMDCFKRKHAAKVYEKNARCVWNSNLSFFSLHYWSYIIMIWILDSPGKCCWLPAPCSSLGYPVAVSDAQSPLGQVPPVVSVTINRKTEFLTTVTVSIAIFYRSADKSLARPGRKLATATEDFEFKVVSCKVVVGKIDIKDVSVHAVALWEQVVEGVGGKWVSSHAYTYPRNLTEVSGRTRALVALTFGEKFRCTRSVRGWESPRADITLSFLKEICCTDSIQGVPGGMDKTSGECSLCWTIPI